MGSNPVQARNFFRLHFLNCLSCVYNCDDPSLIQNYYCKLFDRTVSLLIFQTGPFSIDTGILSTFNQQLWLLCQIKLNGTKAGNIMYYEEQWLPVNFTISKTSYHHLKFQQNTNLFQILEANFSDYSIFTSIHFNCFHVVKCNLLCQGGNT